MHSWFQIELENIKNRWSGGPVVGALVHEPGGLSSITQTSLKFSWEQYQNRSLAPHTQVSTKPYCSMWGGGGGKFHPTSIGGLIVVGIICRFILYQINSGVYRGRLRVNL